MSDHQDMEIITYHATGSPRLRYRCTRAEPPLANASTSESFAMLTSPG